MAQRTLRTGCLDSNPLSLMIQSKPQNPSEFQSFIFNMEFITPLCISVCVDTQIKIICVPETMNAELMVIAIYLL